MPIPRNIHFGKETLLAVTAPLMIGILGAPQSHAQSSAASPAFVVVSIKPVAGGSLGTGSVHMLPDGRLTAEKVLLRYFIQNAYGLMPAQIYGGPAWVHSARFDIEAKAEGNPGEAQMRLMMQALLRDRFKLKVRRETAILPLYDHMTVATGGLKLPPPKEGGCMAPDPTAPPVPPTPGQAPPIPCGRFAVAVNPPVARLDGAEVSMAKLTAVLSHILGRSVVDKTGFAGTFDFHLDFAFDEAVAGIPAPTGQDDHVDWAVLLGVSGRPAPPAGPAPPSILAALEKQLGLKLQPIKGPVELLVIDHVERPSGN